MDTLVGLPDGRVFVWLGSYFAHIPDVVTFNGLGFDWNSIQWMDSLPGPEGDPLNSLDSHPTSPPPSPLPVNQPTVTYDIPTPFGGSETVTAPPPSSTGQLPPVVQQVIETYYGSDPAQQPTVTPNEDDLDPSDDPEAGDMPTEDDYAEWDDIADEWAADPRSPLAAGTTKPGTIIQGPYGPPGSTHSRTEPPNNWQSDNAVDIWLFPGTWITAVADGVVSRSYGYGLMDASGGRFSGCRLHIEHDSGMVSFYQHLRYSISGGCGISVVRGQRVRRGDRIGFSGIANGVPHLHFAVNPPFSPYRFAPLAYNLTHRARSTDITAGGVTVPVTVGAINDDVPERIGKAWNELTNTIGHGIPAAANTIDKALDRLRKL